MTGEDPLAEPLADAVRRYDMRTERTRPRLVTFAAIAVLGLTACGGSADAPTDEPAPTSTGETSAPPSEPPTQAPSGKPSGKPGGKPGALTTVRGTVGVGVEPGCRLLRTDGETLLLVGVAADRAPEGQRLVVTGVRNPGLMTTCQEGVPFEVRTLGPDDAG